MKSRSIIACALDCNNRNANNKQGKYSKWLRIGGVCGLVLSTGSVRVAEAQTTGALQGAQTDGNGKSAPTTPLGVLRLPQDAPPTGLQKPVPPAAFVSPRADRPAAASPNLATLDSRLSEQPLTISDAVSIALSTNRQLALAGESLYRAQGRTSEARAALNPGLGLSVGPEYLANSIQPGGSIAVTLPVDISGALRAATSQAQFQEVATRLDINRTRNQIVYDVRGAFYNVLRSQALVGVATENLQNSLDRLKDANLRYGLQTVAYFDVVRAQTDVANAQRLVIQARNGVSLNVGNLNSAIGIDVTTPLHISDRNAVEQPPGVAPPTVPPITPQSDVPPGGTGNGVAFVAPTAEALQAQTIGLVAPRPDAVVDEALRMGPDFDPILKEALATRPEVLEADAQIAAAKRGIQYARRSRLPGLSLSLGYYNLRNSTGTTRIDEPEAGVGISLPLFDGGLARAREQQARADIATATTNRRQAIDQVTLDVQQAYLNLVQARDQVAVANVALAQARTGFQLARVRYNVGVARAGISPQLEVSDAQAALTQAESNQVNAIYDYNQSRSQLDRAIGRFAFVPGGTGYAQIPTARILGRTSR